MSDLERAYAQAQARARETLLRVADALGVPLDFFVDDQPGGGDALSELAAFAELMKLWGRLRTDVDRAYVLRAVAEIVEQYAGPPAEP